MDPRTGFPLNCRTPPLLGASGHYTVHHAQTHRHLLSPRSRSSTFHPPGAPVLPDSFSCSLAERHTTAGVVVSLVVGVAFSAAAFRLRQLLSAPPVLRVSTARPRFPRARTAALDRVASPPRGVEPALPGRRVAPAPAASLLSSARPPPPPAPLQARGGVALPVEGRGDPAATATGLPPVSSYVPTPLAEAASAHPSPPPTADPKPPLGPSGLGLPARRRARYRIAATPLPQLLLPGTPASGGAVPDPPGYSERTPPLHEWCRVEPRRHEAGSVGRPTPRPTSRRPLSPRRTSRGRRGSRPPAQRWPRRRSGWRSRAGPLSIGAITVGL